MKFYFAPMEGITGYVFRNAHHRYFNHIETYYTPFITPNQTRRLTSRELNDVRSEHNEGVLVVPQVLTNKAEDFLWAAGKLRELGYDRVNFNLGCPSGTVVSKGRGSGFLAFPMELDECLYRICDGMEQMGMRLSVKTRIGKESSQEFEELLGIFNRYPLEKLIIHPRIQTDYYRNHPNLEVFRMALENSKNPVIYNGDLFSAQDIRDFHERFPDVEEVMIGRGLLTNPALAGDALAGETELAGKTELVGETALTGKTELATASTLDKARLKGFHDMVLEGYRESISGDRNVLFKMKELWFYMKDAFADSKKQEKRIRKAEKMSDYKAAVAGIFEECELAREPVFDGWR